MKKFVLLLIALAAMGLPNVWAYDFSAVAPSGQTLYYNISGGNAEVTYQKSSSPRYSNLTGALVIPASVTYNGTTYSVTSIRSWAFEGCSGLRSVTIPNSVTTIGSAAFYNCNGLRSVTIPNSVTSIGGSAFYDCYGLTSVTIPNSVTSIEGSAFYGCYGLTSVTIPNSVTSIGGSAFRGCSGLTSVTIPNSVRSIGSYAFYYCSSLTSVTIPNSVTTIGNYAFYGCSGLTSVTIPNSVTSIGDGAFDGMIYISYCGSATGSPWGATTVGCFYEEGDFLFVDATKATILAYIGTGTSVAIPNSVTTIGYRAFYNCSGLTSVTIPNSVTSIGEEAFKNCSGLTSVTIPNSVTTIGNYAFYYCSGLTSVTIPESVVNLGKNAFFANGGNLSVQFNAVHCNAGYIDGSIYYPFAPSSVRNISIGSSVESIPRYLFYNDSLVSTSINIPSSVTEIGKGAFRGCSRVPSITIPNTIQVIDSMVFAQCSSLSGITIPSSVSSIKYAAFRYCSALTSVTIGNSVTSIGEEAFKNCSGLTEMTVLATVPPSLGNGVFDGVDRNIPVYIPCGRTQYYLARDVWNEFNNYQEVSGAVLTVASNNELWGTAEIQQAHTCASPTAIIRANAKSGYHFVRWNDNNTNNPRTVTVTADVTLTAYFVRNASQYTVTASSGNPAMGSVTGSGTYDEGTEVTLTAVANQGFAFDHWSNGATANPYTFTVTGDIVLTAYFTLQGGTQGIDETKADGLDIRQEAGFVCVSGAEGEMLAIYDIAGRVIVREQAVEGKAYTMPRAGVYMVKVGSSPARKVVVLR